MAVAAGWTPLAEFGTFDRFTSSTILTMDDANAAGWSTGSLSNWDPPNFAARGGPGCPNPYSEDNGGPIDRATFWKGGSSTGSISKSWTDCFGLGCGSSQTGKMLIVFGDHYTDNAGTCEFRLSYGNLQPSGQASEVNYPALTCPAQTSMVSMRVVSLEGLQSRPDATLTFEATGIGWCTVYYVLVKLD